ncbi:MAG TPA: TonB C-terminal domain-containing protein [Gemmatimonadaceae bacterium]|nr:TonB C-terminal domain-containing protein [Gemmatimonadaceae bacterium]
MRAAALRVRSGRFGYSAALSVCLHLALALLVVQAGRGGGAVMPPVYRVTLVAAPAGARAVGVVTEQPTVAGAPEAPPKRLDAPREPAVSERKAAPVRRAPAKATPVPEARSSRRDEAATKAGGGPEGGRGADVANVSTPGIEFPFPAYLENVVRQIALRFNPRSAQTLSAEVVFIIRRDGSVVDIRLRRSSGVYWFDVEALGAVESAARQRAFGPLPDGFSDDALTVIFSFDPRIIR